MPMVSLDLAPDYSGEYTQNNCPCIYLSQEQCDALGIQGSIDAGTVIGINARCVVTRSTTSIDSVDDTDKDVCLTLSITDAEITDAASTTSKADAAKKLYAKD